MGVAALILGIIGLILSVIPPLQTWGLILGLVALILGAVGKKKSGGVATAGLVLGIIAVVLGLIGTIVCGGWVGFTACLSCAAA